MKLAKIFTIAVAAACTLPMMTSCLKDDNKYPDYYTPNAIVTVKPNEDNSAFYIQVDDEHTALVTNLTKSPFGTKEVRAIANISTEDADAGEHDMAIKVNWIDSLLTKEPINMAVITNGADGDEDGDGEGNGEVDYGDDGIDVYDSFFTLVEDGYLNLHFRTLSGNNAKHWLNLLINTTDDPYLVEFRQKTEGDIYYGEYRDGLVAFKLKGFLPDTEGETVKLKVKWVKLNGETRTVEFDYCTPEEK